MKKTALKIISLSLSIALVFSVCSVSFASAEENSTNYPYVFVHGMMGWGSYDGVDAKSPYWGGDTGDMLSVLESKGYECYSASVGKISSNWDRACELYAQLTGTRVDYGAAHSAECGHLRYGRSYEGRALIENFDAPGLKINLIGHSLGGPTVRLFTYLLANGSEAEVAAAQNAGTEVSPLFTGGKGNKVYSVTTLSAPFNGTPVADNYMETPVICFLLATFANLFGSSSVPGYWDYQLEQFGLTSVPDEGIKATFSFSNIKKFVDSGDHCGKDLTVDASLAANEWLSEVEGVYYFTYCSDITADNGSGGRKASGFPNPLFLYSVNYIGSCSGKTTAGGYTFTDEWEPNDGMVPPYSAAAPFDEPHMTNEQANGQYETGIWYSMPIAAGYDHVSYMGMTNSGMDAIYEAQMALINSL